MQKAAFQTLKARALFSFGRAFSKKRTFVYHKTHAFSSITTALNNF